MDRFDLVNACAHNATITHMTAVVASRDLRNHTGDLLRRVAEGARFTVTVNGKPVAELGPVIRTRALSLTRGELVELLDRHPADLGLRTDLVALGDETTEDLLPL